ncbi:hypothetical protein [Carboxylicivirga litoralis]|nr:hypothetical protein [Carboxylicivirga sp. A043]
MKRRTNFNVYKQIFIELLLTVSIAFIGGLLIYIAFIKGLLA